MPGIGFCPFRTCIGRPIPSAISAAVGRKWRGAMPSSDRRRAAVFRRWPEIRPDSARCERCISYGFSLFGRKAGKSIRPDRSIRPSPCRPSGPRCSAGPYRSRFRRRHPCDCSGIRAAAPDDIRPGRACNGPFACRGRAFRSAPCSGRGRDSCPCGRPFVASG